MRDKGSCETAGASGRVRARAGACGREKRLWCFDVAWWRMADCTWLVILSIITENISITLGEFWAKRPQSGVFHWVGQADWSGFG